MYKNRAGMKLKKKRQNMLSFSSSISNKRAMTSPLFLVLIQAKATHENMWAKDKKKLFIVQFFQSFKKKIYIKIHMWPVGKC